MGLVEEGILPDAEILQVSAARSKVLGRYHMMMGQNPVYIISAGGRKPGQV
jgi:precorrin-6Y C5,15-methyltransferase (decarboxylating)